MSRVRSMRAWGPSTAPTACAPAGWRCSLWGWRKGVPGGGVLSTVLRGAWCQALSLPRPPVLWSGPPGFRVPCVPGAVRAGVGTQHRPHSVRPCWPALLAVGVGKGVPGGGAFNHCEGRLRSGAVPPPTARPGPRLAHRFYVMDTEAFDFVLKTDFFVQHSQIQSLTLQAPYLLYVDHGNGRESVPLEQSEHTSSYLRLSEEEPSNMMAPSKSEDYQLLGEVLDQGLKELGYPREDLSVELFASDKQHVLDLHCSKGKNCS